MVFRPPPRFALAKGLEHFINILLGPAGPPQHLPGDVLHVLHGHVILVRRRIINMCEAAVVNHGGLCPGSVLWLGSGGRSARVELSCVSKTLSLARSGGRSARTSRRESVFGRSRSGSRGEGAAPQQRYVLFAGISSSGARTHVRPFALALESMRKKES